MNIVVRDLDDADRPYVVSSWRESHKQSPETRRVPWEYYKHKYGTMINKLVADPTTTLVGAYDENGLLGWLAMSYGKRVNALHWVHVKFERDKRKLRRLGLMSRLLREVDVGSPFIYTMRAAKRRAVLPDGSKSKSLDEILAAKLAARGQIATFVSLEEWFK